jgi:hypothetical protein
MVFINTVGHFVYLRSAALLYRRHVSSLSKMMAKSEKSVFSKIIPTLLPRWTGIETGRFIEV